MTEATMEHDYDNIASATIRARLARLPWERRGELEELLVLERYILDGFRLRGYEHALRIAWLLRYRRDDYLTLVRELAPTCLSYELELLEMDDSFRQEKYRESA